MEKGSVKLLLAGAGALFIFGCSLGFLLGQTGSINKNKSPFAENMIPMKVVADSSARAATTTIRWAGYTSTTYDGLLGKGAPTGVKAGSQICQANYAGSYWAESADIIYLGSQYPWTQTAWLQDYYADVNLDCAHFGGNSGAQGGTLVDTKTIYPAGTNSGWACSNSLYLACVHKP